MHQFKVFAAGALAVVLLAAQPATPAPTLAVVLSSHLRALHALKATPPRSLVTEGTLQGLGLEGSFHTWRDGADERYDETLGIRTQRTLRVDGREFVQNANGDVRELRGLVQRRQLTEDFIDSGEFARHPENAVLLGAARLRDGREVWQLRVTAPNGEPFGVSLDATTWMVDEKAYVNGDGLQTFDYSDYALVAGALYPRVTVESSGDSAFDITARVTQARANEPVDRSIFAPLTPAVVDAAAPVTLPLLVSDGHFFVRGSAGGRPLLLLIDSGSQGVFLDTEAARRLGLTPQGTLEVRGAKRTAGAGVAALDRIDLGAAGFPVRVVSVVDLSAVTYRGIRVDGVLGYPFFAAAEVRVDPDRLTMTVARPGTLPVLGVPLPIDTDRELPEMLARVNDKVDGRFLVDTGNSSELLVFHAFLQAHPGLVFYGTARTFTLNHGVGGSSSAVAAIVDRLGIGPFNMYNRRAEVMLADSGAFADGNDAGNVGLGTLANFVFTFDFAGGRLYLEKARSFDDGRYRPQYEQLRPNR
ncbi:MAG TPA: pepsin/retropepsin-like aspartic protease family protein [Candidatus Tumulicola sp.]|jgi:predicted aspartyl protease